MKTKEELIKDISNGIYDDYFLPSISREQNESIILDMLLERTELIVYEK